MTHISPTDRYDSMTFRRVGDSGLKLPSISLGTWQNFGDINPLETQRAIYHRAFDLGICHFDFANNYGPPPGSTERNFGRILREDFKAYRDELVISTKAGYNMWSGPHGEWGSRKHMLASLDQSLSRMGLDYVDIFYSHRADPETPLEETMGALSTAVQSGKALYVGISSYSPQRTLDAANILREMGTPLLIHQPSYSMFNRWIEGGLLDVLKETRTGCIPFSPLAQGMLTDRYLDGIPQGSRAARKGSIRPNFINDESIARVRALAEIARKRDQSLAQMAIAWVLRHDEVSSVLLGASRVNQLEENLKALDNTTFTESELAEIDTHAIDLDINLWAQSSAN